MHFEILALLVIQTLAKVTVLTPETFDTVVGKDKPVLVEFYAPWCGHCKQLAPVYEELAASFDPKKVVIANVDADAHKALGSRFGVTGFPTLKWFPASSTVAEDYKGGRDLEALSEFVTTKSGVKSSIKKQVSYVKELNTVDAFNEVVGKKNALVEFYAPWCGHCKALKPIYESLAKTFANEPDCVIANVDATVNKDSATLHEVSGYPTIKFFGAGDVKGVPFDGERTEEAFVKYLNEVCKTNRKAGGGLTSNAGLIEEFAPIVKEFADKATRTKAYEEAKKLSEKLKTIWASFYVKVMEKVLKVGDEYLFTEVARINKIISSGNTALEKIDSFEIRRNILESFSKPEESEEEVRDEL